MILIPFSSGLDSTVLLHNALEKKEKFKVCYINIKNNVQKSRIEQQQRKKIIDMFEKKYNTYINDNVDIEFSLCRNNVISLPQVPVWIMGLLYSIDSRVKEIRLGYCMNDDAVSYIDDIKKIWKAYQSISDEKLPKLTFPIIKKRKTDHYQVLPSEIFQETFFCEDPTVIDFTKEDLKKSRTSKQKTKIFKELSVSKSDNEPIVWKDCGQCGTCSRAKYEGTFQCYNRNQTDTNIKFSSSPVEEKDAMVVFN